MVPQPTRTPSFVHFSTVERGRTSTDGIITDPIFHPTRLPSVTLLLRSHGVHRFGSQDRRLLSWCGLEGILFHLTSLPSVVPVPHAFSKNFWSWLFWSRHLSVSVTTPLHLGLLILTVVSFVYRSLDTESWSSSK